MLVQLDQSRILKLEECLSLSMSSMLSLPLRHQLFYISSNIIADGRVYVDQWPVYSIVCCLNTSAQFANPKFDFDLATFYQTNETPDQTDQFEAFLQALATERGWKEGRSLYGNFVRSSLMHSFQNILGEFGEFHVYGSLFLNSGLQKPNLEKYKNRYDQLLPQLPTELVPDALALSDVDTVVQTWDYAPSGLRRDYFRWLVLTFPSTCLRAGKELVSWACCYSCGGIANMFIDQRYRGRGLSEYLWLSIALKIIDFSPVPLYFSTFDHNVASQRSAAKTFHLDYKNDETSLVWFYFDSRAKVADEESIATDQ